MCGIVGYVGKEQAAPILLEGLSKLEYRGYDSAGIAVVSEAHRLQIIKKQGRLTALDEYTNGGKDVEGHIGMGHTRWATHGSPSDINSHPHVSEKGKFAVIHNGIIENYIELKEYLTERSVHFVSETDSEVIAQLLEYYYEELEDLKKAVKEMLSHIEGTYALGIICEDYPDQMIAARKDAPLLIGFGKGSHFLASDATALVQHTRDVVYLENGETAVLTRKKVNFYDSMQQKIEKQRQHIEWTMDAVEKEGYQHFMLKEIMEQADAVRRTIAPRIQNGEVSFEGLNLTLEKIMNFQHIMIVACGSAYHAGVVGKYVFERLLRINAEVFLSSEFRYSDPVITDQTLVVVISQSGETFDTMAALRLAKQKSAYVLSIVNVVGSSIAREADDVIYTHAGPEIAVATTKGFSTQLAALDLLALYLGQRRHIIEEKEYARLVKELLSLPDKMTQAFGQEECIQKYVSKYVNHSKVFYIGRNIDYAIGLEASLKLKETSYIPSEAYAAGELKHGTIALIEKGTLVIALGSCGRLFEKTVNNILEVKARGAQILGVTTEKWRRDMNKIADDTIVIPDAEEIFLPSLAIIPQQLFAYYAALQRGCDIDKPRNLAKSVTVE